jgi:hypothetical protein
MSSWRRPLLFEGERRRSTVRAGILVVEVTSRATHAATNHTAPWGGRNDIENERLVQVTIVPVPAEELFRHKVLSLLRRRGLLSEERIELLLSWRHSGFSVHNRVFAHPGQGRDLEALVRYMMPTRELLTRQISW